MIRCYNLYSHVFAFLFFILECVCNRRKYTIPNFQEHLERELLAIRPFQSTFKVFTAGLLIILLPCQHNGRIDLTQATLGKCTLKRFSLIKDIN